MGQNHSSFRKTVFNNGLTVLTERHHGFKGLSLGAWILTGTRYEKGFPTGISHFTEHMLFKGTKNRTAYEIVREIDRIGGELNAFTTREQTCFHLLLRREDLIVGAEILADLLLHPLFDPNEIQTEKKVIRQEIDMTKDTPEEYAFDLFFEKCFARQDLGRPILGTKSSIQKIDQKTLRKFFKERYSPAHTILAISGDISHEEIIQKLHPLTLSPSRKEKKIRYKNSQMRSGFWWIPSETEQVQLIWGVPTFPYSSSERFGLFLLNTFLGGGMSSLLFQEVREKRGLAYSVYSSLSPYFDIGLLNIHLGTHEKQLESCAKVIRESLDSLRNQPLSKKELEETKSNLIGTIELSSDSMEWRMNSIAQNEIYFGKYFEVGEVIHQIQSVTSEQIQDLAKSVLDLKKQSVLILGPKTSALKKKRMKEILFS